ncbi:hypothetical protein FBD94_23105 [Pedobacter hiemivivus]|uniref:RHS repeat-associated core domain-containing protein n=1 Tax=Pedobacter hiemivivus TaxID=2530454 RepID=A0A4U1G0I4_9SPHI|nr:hypothetical protein [Pedobacter hiemivivus]TKC56604.1 hypothetical protein FBD94_23105 [Pedobacter hiemivivus]
MDANVVSYGIGSKLNLVTGKQDASYRYYLHGPLARVDLGREGHKVQGLDYAYTLQGWLKGVNGNTLQPGNDQGGDGTNGSRESWNGNGSDKYKEDYTYDGNGNILTLQRNGSGGSLMDSLSYTYNKVNGKLQNNRLSQLNDLSGSGNQSGELPAGLRNYGYDAIGNLIAEGKAGENSSAIECVSSSIVYLKGISCRIKNFTCLCFSIKC